MELQRLETLGIIEKVQQSEWAAPVVPVLKANGQHIRICGDFMTTINGVSDTDLYPRVEDLYARFADGQTLTKIDLNNTYLQVLLDEESKKYTAINTNRGLFQFTRLPISISSSPGIFQRIIYNLLSDIPGVCCYVDDILITGIR